MVKPLDSSKLHISAHIKANNNKEADLTFNIKA